MSGQALCFRMISSRRPDTGKCPRHTQYDPADRPLFPRFPCLNDLSWTTERLLLQFAPAVVERRAVKWVGGQIPARPGLSMIDLHESVSASVDCVRLSSGLVSWQR